MDQLTPRLRSIERIRNATGAFDVRVTLDVGTATFITDVPDTDTFADAEGQAIAELHRISSQIAAAGSGPGPSTPPSAGESERERKWRENQEQSGSGWAV